MICRSEEGSWSERSRAPCPCGVLAAVLTPGICRSDSRLAHMRLAFQRSNFRMAHMRLAFRHHNKNVILMHAKRESKIMK